MSPPVRSQKSLDAEVIQNVLLALANAVDLDHALEIILVELRDLLDYDRAGLFVLDENLRFIVDKKPPSNGKTEFSTRGWDDPIIRQLESNKQPLVFQDIEHDDRFQDWKDMKSIRSWIGAPLLIDNRLIGFLSIGSLHAGKYNAADARMIQTFAFQIAALLEKTWMHQLYDRRAEELEVISAFSIALGQASGTEFVLSKIFDQISELFGEQTCSIIFPDDQKKELIVKYSMDSSICGLGQTQGPNILWNVFLSGKPVIMSNHEIQGHRKGTQLIYQLADGSQMVIAAPLISGGSISGVLLSSFTKKSDFSKTDITLFNTIAEIAGNALERVLILERLDHKVQTRTRYLSTLYEINSYANEQLDHEKILEFVLEKTLEILNLSAGAIYLFKSPGMLELVSYSNFEKAHIQKVDKINLSTDPWYKLFKRIDLNRLGFINTPEEHAILAYQFGMSDGQRILISPITSKSDILGYFLGFCETISKYSLDEFSLLKTISGQLGNFIERDHLISKAEASAVIEERQRLARELHDSVTQLIYGQLLFAGAGKRVLGKNNIPLTSQYLKRIEDQAQQALKEMRLLVYELQPSDHLDQGIQIAINTRLDAVEKRSGILTFIKIDPDINLDNQVELELYRITQEALNNTIKHSSSDSVTVTLTQENDTVLLEILDDGCGFNYPIVDSYGGMGIQSMMERAKAIGGELSIESQPGSGTRVIVKVGV